MGVGPVALVEARAVSPQLPGVAIQHAARNLRLSRIAIEQSARQLRPRNAQGVGPIARGRVGGDSPDMPVREPDLAQPEEQLEARVGTLRLDLLYLLD